MKIEFGKQYKEPKSGLIVEAIKPLIDMGTNGVFSGKVIEGGKLSKWDHPGDVKHALNASAFRLYVPKGPNSDSTH